MRAIQCVEWGGPELLQLNDVASPVAKPGEVVVRTRAAGVNFPDVLIIQKKYQMQPPLPFIPGAEISGDVIAVGENVTHLAVGDPVLALCSIGGFAEEIAIEAARCVKIPPGIGYDVAAGFMLAYATSWHALVDRAALQAGETVLVLGAAGGVGLAAVEIAKAMGARVIAAASSDEKCEICRAHGADETINYSAEDLREGIKRTTGGAGPNVIYDPVGGKYAEPAFRSIGWRGRYLVIGFADGGIPALPWNLALLKGASLVGVFWGEFARREPKGQIRCMTELFGWLLAGQLKPLVSGHYQLADAPQALVDMAARKVTGKIVITP
ncbi:MAG: NADPH:quinone oxidoreductase [Rhodospirillales bacterium 20-60-12]|nr:MAG: NADPH:quinone oxidoreductase [Rhodospirillales bacterium 20-60-12]HQT68720.1 NADPH:quinone oxidoreductase family protein [Acetobacteraceae bacterium]